MTWSIFQAAAFMVVLYPFSLLVCLRLRGSLKSMNAIEASMRQ